MKALCFAGAFNPPTRAHIETADFVRKKLGYDKVVFVPSKSDYITDEQGKNFSFSDETRLEMLRMISVERPWMDVYEGELMQDHQPRTYDTLCALKDHYDELKLLFGSDKLPELQSGWLHVEEICHEFGIVVMSRSHDDPHEIMEQDPYLKKLEPYITIVETPGQYQNISSTSVRELLSRTRDDLKELERLVPDELNGLKDYL